MRLFTTLSMCLICTAAFSQVPPPNGGPQQAINPAMQRGVQPGFNTMPGTPVTERSRVRAFNAGADGQIRSVYLSNGSVVDLSGFGPQFGSQLRKGNRIRLSGTRTTVNGQTIIIPQQITVNQQTYAAMANQGPLGQPGVGQPGPGQPGVGAPGGGVGAPPPGGPGAPPPPPPMAGGHGAPPPPPMAGGHGAPPPPPPPMAGGHGAPPPPPPMAGGPGAPPPPPLGQSGPGRPGAGPRRGDARRPGAAAGQPVAPPADGTQPPQPPVAPATSVTPGTAAPVPPAATSDQTVNQ